MRANEPKDVVKLAKMLHIQNLNKLLQDWPLFRKQIYDNFILCTSTADLAKSPEVLWTSILNSPTYQISLEIRNLLRTILVIPTGT